MATPVRNILIAPLDWGLGHTTRCIPIIRQIITSGHTVLFAGNPRQRALIATQCPQVLLHHLDGYDVRYGRRRLMLRLLSQMPRLTGVIGEEHAWLRTLAKEVKIDGIISDNRYGLWHPQIPCVFMTHQLRVRTGFGRFADDLLQRIHYRLLKRFSECWIVDIATDGNLAGELAHPPGLLSGVKYIGWLSQLADAARQNAAPAKYKCLILLSGPEPQRTLLSDQLWAQIQQTQHRIAFVAGTPAAVQRENLPSNISHYSQADAAQIASLMQASELVICRSGYSTLMDLICLGKRAALIPTPGQTEQEYLAKTLSRSGMFYAPWPPDAPFDKAIEIVSRSSHQPPDGAGCFTQFIPVLEEWLGRF